MKMPPPASLPAESERTAGTARHLGNEADRAEVFYDPSVLPLLGGHETLLEHFLTLLAQDVQQERLPVTRIEVRGTNDAEDDTSQILVRLWLNRLSDQEIRDYYRSFGRRVDDWARQLSDEQRQFFMTRVSFQARRAVNA